jgi:hypothetical protein
MLSCYYVECKNWFCDDSWTHFFNTVLQDSIDITYLKNLCKNKAEKMKTTCVYVKLVKTCQEQCDMSISIDYWQRMILTDRHQMSIVASQESIIQIKKCEVEFVWIVSKNLKKISYVLFAS